MALRIEAYMHCSECLRELPFGVSPKEYQRIQAGFTAEGFQVWCLRHDRNILDVSFDGAKVRYLGDDYGETFEQEGHPPWCAGSDLG